MVSKIQYMCLTPKVMLFLWLSLFVICKIGFINGDTCTWDNCPKWNTNPSIMNIHIIPHTHDDLGWIITADDYYRREVRYILSTMTLELAKNPNRRFSYCETGYLTRWLEDFPNTGAETIKTLIQNGQLEIIGGGWVQPDEAATHYIDLVDQYTLGLRLLNNSFGSCARPKTAWQIDPFGHSREHANLMAMMGYDSLWFAREHYLEHEMRRSNRALQMMWHVSDDNQTTILTGAFYAHYNMPGGFNFDIMGNDDPIQDNPNLENYNLDEKLSTFVNDLITYNQSMLHNHIMILMGDDFTYQDANMWFTNLDKLITHLNQNYSNILTAFYSTPTCYAQAIKSISTIQWPQKYTDFFPYASGTDSLWTGYFTSKPTMKGLVRKSSALLQLIRQLQSLALTSWDVQQGAQVEALERAIALSQHHDGITGTSKQSVTQDYMMRMLQGWTSGEQVLNSAMQTISQRVKKNVVQFPQQIICRNVNESECAFTKNNNVYTVTVHNGNSQTLNALVKVPLYQATKNVAVADYQGNPINVEISTVFTNVSQLDNTNMASYEINFMANVGPLGFRTYFVTVTPSTNDFDPPKSEVDHNNDISAATNSISNGLIQLDFDSQGYLSTFHDLTTGKDYPLSQQFSYYRGNGPNIGNGQNSGAYAFRPNPNTPVNFTDPIKLSIVNGTIVNEARQTVSPWVSQIIRLIPNKKLVEFEWTVGPIPAGDQISKEVITTYNVNGLNTNKIFWTDANGRQLMKRTRNWGEDFTYVNYEPVAGNYYPINSRIIVSDGTTSLAVLTDRSNGGSSINDGQVEIMLHRRDFYDDGYGVGEALNEPGRDGRGLVVRGKHWLVLGNAAEVTQAHRSLAYELFHAPVLTFSTYTSSDQYRNNFVTDYAGLQQALPSNIHLLTLKQVDSSNILLRLEHIYQSMEVPTLSQPVSINLASLFSYDIVQIQELSLAANNVSGVLAGTTITLNHMDIKTYLLNVNVGNQGCTCSGSWYQSSINPCNCYNFVQTPTDWTSANNDCRKQNPRASLSSVDSAFENNELLSLLQSKTSCSQAFIGMTQQTSNVWSWINNDTSLYRNWRTGYPSGNNQCSQLNTNDGKWTNIDCTTQGCYVCEIKN